MAAKKAMSALLFCICAVMTPGCRKRTAWLCDHEAEYVTTTFEVPGVAFTKPDPYRDYLGWDAASLFDHTGLDFVEIAADKSAPQYETALERLGQLQVDRLYSKRYIKVFLAAETDPACLHQGDDWLAREEREQFSRRHWCIAAVPIEILSSPILACWNYRKDPPIDSSLAHITNRTTGAVLSRARNFYYESGNAKFSGTMQCRHLPKFWHKDFTANGLVRSSVFRPCGQNFEFMQFSTYRRHSRKPPDLKCESPGVRPNNSSKPTPLRGAA